MDRVAILVAGMHRSGTSALSRMLASLGCDLPKTLLEPNEYNVTGYWESKKITSLNDELLESAGSSWDDWEPFNADWYASPLRDDFSGRAQSLLESEFGDSRLLVLKDPRVCRLLPFWLDALTEFGVSVRVALPIRNPLEVAASLEKRDAIHRSVGLLIWLRHVLEAEAGSREFPRTLVRFEDLLRDWHGLAESMGRDMQVSWPRRSTAVDFEIDGQLEPSNRHQVAEDADIFASPEVSRWVSGTFEIVDRWIGGGEQERDRGVLDGMRSALNDAGSVFAKPVFAGVRAAQRSRALEQEVDALGAKVVDRDGQIDSLNRAVADRDENVAYLDGVIGAKDGELDKLGSLLADRDREIDAFKHVVAGRDGEITTLKDTVAARDVRVVELDGEIAARDERINEFQWQASERDRELHSLARDVTNLQATAETRAQRISVLERETDALRRTVDERRGELAELTGALADRNAEIAALRDAEAERDVLRQTAQDRLAQIDGLHEVIEGRDAELAGVYASSSWRLTKPLRGAKKSLLAGYHGLSRAFLRIVRATLRIVWRMLPLPRSSRERIKRAAIGSFAFVGPLSKSTAQPPPAGRGHRASGWLDLADLNYEAKRNGTDRPILFDPEWYLATYPDIRTAGMDPLAHYLEHGALEGRWPVELAPAEVDVTIEALHRLDLAGDEARAFDAEFCRVLYPELAGLNDSELAMVCGNNGERVSSKGAFVAEICEDPREIPLDFDAAEYIRLYPDLRYLVDQSPLEALRHYMRHGRFEPRLHTLRTDPAEAARDPASAADSEEDATEVERPLCVLAHVYYPELWEELSGYIRNLPQERYDLYVNLVDDTFDGHLLAGIRDAFPHAHVYVSENVGRDIGGFRQLLRNLHVEDYRLFCLLHTKKSPHMAEGEVQRWRRKLLEPLMGTSDCAAENVRTMLEDEKVGIIGSAQCRYSEMNANREKYDELLERLGIDESSQEVEFLSGTMMFVRPAVLQRVFEAAEEVAFEHSEALTVDGDPDGAWAHAVERVFGAVVRDMSLRFEWR